MPQTAKQPEENFKEHDTLIDQGDQEMGGMCSKFVRTKSTRLASMLTLIVVYFLAEIIVGHITNSLTLVADSFHMLSDGLSLVVALIAVRMSKRKAHESITPWPFKQEYFNTFGWVRFEVVGALINATFLLALCISILMEAIEKFYDPQLVSQPLLVLAVGAGGLLINILGLIMFGSHSHGGHDHGEDDHGGDNPAHNKGHSQEKSSKNTDTMKNNSPSQESKGKYVNADNNDVENGKVIFKKETSQQQMNMKAVFLHVLGDALGSVIVMISATVVLLVPHGRTENVTIASNSSCNNGTSTKSVRIMENEWLVYLDPIMSVLLVVIIVSTTIPLFKKSSLVLLQTVPKKIKLHSIKKKLETIEGVQEIHDFHIWQLAGDKYVATVHLQCADSQTYLKVAAEMKARLHDEDIHSLTVQPEFISATPTRTCSMVCASDLCKTKVCCEVEEPPKKKSSKSSIAAPSDKITEINDEEVNVVFNISPSSSQAAVASPPPSDEVLG